MSIDYKTLSETLSKKVTEQSTALNRISNLVSLNGIYEDSTNVLLGIAEILEETGRPINLDGGDDSYEED